MTESVQGDTIIKVLTVYKRLTAQRCYVQKKNPFSRKSQFNTKIVCHIVWTYDLCAADAGIYYDYY